MRRFPALLVTLAVAMACTGPTDSTERDGAANVIVAIVTAPTGATAPSLSAGMADGIPAGAIASFDVTLTRLEVRMEGEGPWIDVPLDGGQTVSFDMLSIPAETPLMLAEHELDPGLYTDVRLFLSDATIELSETVCPGETDPSDAAPEELCVSGTVDAIFPSSMETGIKTDAQFEVDMAHPTEVVLAFDPAATFGNVAWVPGLDQVVVSPVIRAHDGGE